MKIKNHLTTYLLIALTIVFAMSCGQTAKTDSEAEHEHADAMDHDKATSVNNAEAVDGPEEIQVKSVLKEYKTALENLTVDSTDQLFTTNSEIIENGGVEGTYQAYMDHHIGPELDHFKSFKFNDYKVKVIVDGDYAFGTETYVFVITLKEDEKVIERKAVSTSVLHKEGGQWKIMKAHGSSRAVRKK